MATDSHSEPATLTPTFRTRDDPPGVTVVDHVQGRQFPLETTGPASPRSTDTDRFHFPVESAVTVTTDAISLPYVVALYVRDASGELVLEAEEFAYETLPADEYVVELLAPIKIYLRVEGPLTVLSSTDRMELQFDETTDVRVGARSYHDRPATTVTTTADPGDLMAAVSTFGSALKTTSPERSLPSLRGHPPTLELGDELRIPDGLSPPDTGIRIELPSEREAVYVASTLAYYLGATVVEGDAPRLVADGVEHDLDPPDRGFEREVERVLRRTFFLDCVTRTEGHYRVDLHERREIDDDVDLAFDELYEASPAERLAAYLSVPFDAIHDQLPAWRLGAHVTPAASNVGLLPYVVNGLATVRTAAVDATERPTPDVPDSVLEFLRSGPVSQRRDGGERQGGADPGAYVRPPTADTLEQVWLGDGRPLGANKLVERAFENRFERTRSGEDVDITIVCNDPEMSDEFDASDGGLYGDREELPFDVTGHRELSVAELRAVLETNADFFHYIGHVDDGGFVCHDGVLDVEDVAQVGVDTFLLNGCRSYDQGMALVEAGSVGGVVTYSDVGNESATAIGRLLARLLNCGFSLRAALNVARGQRVVGNQYVVVGDGGREIAQNEAGTPILTHVESTGGGEYEVQVTTYPTLEQGMGAMYIPYIEGVDSHFLSGGDLPAITLSADELAAFLRLEQLPVVVDGEFGWSTDVDL